MLERECQILDIKLAAASENKSTEIIKLFKKVEDLQASIESCEEKIELVHDGITTNIMKTPEKEDEIRKIYIPRLDYLNDKLRKKVNALCFYATQQ